MQLAQAPRGRQAKPDAAAARGHGLLSGAVRTSASFAGTYIIQDGKFACVKPRFAEIFGYAAAEEMTGLDPVAQIALQHHERVDGSGYPQGLKGDAILLEARIMSVADVVEAMSSHRPYRPGLGIDKALAEIERGRGSAYDPAVADACLALFREKGYAMPT